MRDDGAVGVLPQALIGRQRVAPALGALAGLQRLGAVGARVRGGAVVRGGDLGGRGGRAQLPVEQVVLAHVESARAGLEDHVQCGVVRLVEVGEGAQVRVERLELVRERGEEDLVVVRVLDASHSVLLFDLPPGQLSRDALHQHVEQRPQVVLPAQLLALVRRGARVADRPSERRFLPPGPDFAGWKCELSRESEVQQVDGVAGVGAASDREVARFHVAVQEPALVDGADGLQGLHSDPERRGERELESVLALPEVGEAGPLQRHHHVVELRRPAAAQELAGVLATCGEQSHGEPRRRRREETHPEACGARPPPSSGPACWRRATPPSQPRPPACPSPPRGRSVRSRRSRCSGRLSTSRGCSVPLAAAPAARGGRGRGAGGRPVEGGAGGFLGLRADPF